MSVTELDKQYIANTYSRFPVQLARGKGSLLYDENGKEYIDLGSGIATNTFGAADTTWTEAVAAQLQKIQHASNLYYTAPCAELARLLCEKTGMKKVFFSNSGAEANECAIKVARKYALQTFGPGHHMIITLKNGFHGRTITTLSATGQDAFHTDFGPFTEGFVYAQANNARELAAVAKQNSCAAILFETVQGEGGVNCLAPEYISAIEKIAKEQNLLLIVDEVQTGNGRTGKLYSYMHYGLQPDIVTTAKGLGGGLPLGATLLGPRVENVLTPGSHGSTFGGNPVCCAGALSILQRVDDGLLEDVQKKSKIIRTQLSGAKGVKSVSGLGLMLGIEPERPVGEVLSECMEKGVLALSAKTKLRLLPALNIPVPVLEKALAILKEVLAK